MAAERPEDYRKRAHSQKRTDVTLNESLVETEDSDMLFASEVGTKRHNSMMITSAS